jgi:antitoxin component YwqK of YwqJK toxin-antitoxin module
MIKTINIKYIFFILGCLPPLVEAKTYLPSGCSTVTSCTESKNEKGELHGPQTCVNYYKKDIVVIRAFWKNDKLEKDFFCANDDGTPVVQAQYKDGELNGEYKTYNASEKKWNDPITYKAGKREGVAKLTGSNGHHTVVLYKNDKPHGYELQFKDNKLVYINGCFIDNSRKDEKECRNIKIPGYEKMVDEFITAKEKKEYAENNREVIEKYASGQIKERYKLVNSQISGSYEKFYENGKPQIQRTHKDGYKTEEKIYFREGSLESHSFFDKAWEYKTILYYQNGHKKLEREENK